MKIYVYECDKGFDWRDAERHGDFDGIKRHSDEYEREEFQDAVNDEELDLFNCFIYIEE